MADPRPSRLLSQHGGSTVCVVLGPGVVESSTLEARPQAPDEEPRLMHVQSHLATVRRDRGRGRGCRAGALAVEGRVGEVGEHRSATAGLEERRHEAPDGGGMRVHHVVHAAVDVLVAAALG